MGYLFTTLICFFVALIGIIIWANNTRKLWAIMITVFSIIALVVNFFLYTVNSAIDYGKETAYKQIEEQKRIEILTEQQNEIISKLNITSEELELLRAK